MKLKLKKIGNSTGLILRKELLARLNLSPGQWLYAIKTADGGLRLVPFHPTFEKGMEIAERAMQT